MDANRTSLFIGRFQPFHLGHLDAVRQIFAEQKTDFLLIGIGSAEENYTPENPLTAGERFQMIFENLIEAGIKSDSFHICPVRNIQHYGLWVHHVRLLLPPFARVYTGSPLVKMLFSAIDGLEVCTLQDHTQVSGTEVRESIKKGQSLDNKATVATIRLLEAWGGKNRFRDLDRTKIGT